MIACATSDGKNNDKEKKNDYHNNHNQHQSFVQEENQRSDHDRNEKERKEAEKGSFEENSREQRDREVDVEEEDEKRGSELRHSTSLPSLTPKLETQTLEESSTVTDPKYLGQVNEFSEFTINNCPTVICANPIKEGFGSERSCEIYCSDGKPRFESEEEEEEDEEEEEEEEEGPALVIAKSLDEADEDEQYQSYECRTHLDPNEYNPDSEYLSDPDFHDERPGKTFKSAKTQASACVESEELVCPSSGYSKTSGEFRHSNSARLDEDQEEELALDGENSFNVEYCIKLSSIENHGKQVFEIKEVLKNSQDTSSSLEEEEERKSQASNSEAIQVEEEPSISEQSGFQTEISGKESSSEEDDSSKGLEKAEKSDLRVRHSEAIGGAPKEKHAEERHTAIGPHVQRIETNAGEIREDIGPSESTVSFSLITEADTEYEISTLKSCEIKPAMCSRVTELRRASIGENELTSVSECPVTASEARPELYTEESTLAEELTSIQDEESQSSCMLVNSELENEESRSQDDRLDATGSNESDRTTGARSNDGATLMATLKSNHEEFNQKIQRQESLDDIESEVLDIQPEVVMNNQTSGGCIKPNILDSKLLDDSEKKKKMLIDLVSDYCDKLVEQIKNEAFKQIDLITSRRQNIYLLNLSHTLQVESEQYIEESSMNTKSKKIYTSSMYYNDNQDSFPTIEQQVEQCRTIVRQLEGEGSSPQELNDIDQSIQEGVQDKGSLKEELEGRNRHASLMFKRRKDRMDRFTFEDSSEETDDESSKSQKQARARRLSLEPNIVFNSTPGEYSSCERTNVLQYLQSVESDCEETALTDTEYEAPRVRRRATPARATTTPFRELRRTSRHVEMEVAAENEINYIENVDEKNKCQRQNDCRQVSRELKPKFKPFLDSTTLKDIERLRHWSPYGAFNEHNSVSPEECLKLVQDLKSTSSLDTASGIPNKLSHDEPFKEANCHGGNKNDKNIVLSKGAQMFERRQLQSSDWIVCGNDDDDKDNEISKEDKFRFASTSIDQPVKSRPSLSEELVMVADERGEQMVELVPLVMSHAQPQLETATITKTPSFSASSWRVIECDSPDLITSHDGEDGDHELCEDKTDDQVDDEICINSNQGTSADVSASSDIGAPQDQVAMFEERVNNMRILEEEDEEEEEDQEYAENRGRAISSADEKQFCNLDGLHGYNSATVMRSRPQSRSNELHHATLIEWRPQVTTPARMSTVLETSVGSAAAASFLTEYSVDSNSSSRDYSVVKLKQHLPTTMDNYYTSLPTPAASFGNHCTRARSSSFTRVGNSAREPRPLSYTQALDRRGSSVASLRTSYQNLVNQSGSYKYRTYHYPFEDRRRIFPSQLVDDQYKSRYARQRPRCSSLSGYEEYSECNPTRWLPSHSQLDDDYYQATDELSGTLNNARRPQVFCQQSPIESSSSQKEGYSREKRASSSSAYLEADHNCCCSYGSYRPLYDDNSSHTGHASPQLLNSGKCGNNQSS